MRRPDIDIIASVYCKECLLLLDYEEDDGDTETDQPGYDKLYPGHIPTTPFQRGLLAVGSGLMCLYNPARDGTASLPGHVCLLKTSPLFK